MSKSHINSDINTSNAHAYKSLPLKNLTIDSDANTKLLAHYDVSPNDVSGIRPYGTYVDDNTIVFLDMGVVVTKNSTSYIFDKSKYGNFGRVVGATITNGRNGKAMKFGTNQYIGIPKPNQPIVDLTLEAWIYPAGVPTNDRAFIIGQSNAFYLTMDTTYHVATYWYDKNPAGYHTSTGVLPLNTWSHIVATWNGTTHKIYINGTLDKTIAVTGTGRIIDNPIAIGNEGNSRQFFGSIDRAVILNRAITDDEVKQRYNEAIYSLSGMGYGKYGGAIAVEEATVNLLTNPDGNIVANGTPGSYKPGWDEILHSDAITVGTWSSGYNGGVTAANTGYHAKWVYEGPGTSNPCMKFIDMNETISQPHRWLGITQSLGTPSSLGWVVGTVVTISWLQKSSVLNKGADVGIYHMRVAEGTNGFEDAKVRVNVSKTDVWERASFTFTVTSNWNLTASCTIYVYGNQGTSGVLWVDDVQIEQKSFPTSFVNGAREAGKLYYPIDISAPATISFWVKPRVPDNYSTNKNWIMNQVPYSNNLLIWKETTENYYRVRITSDVALSPGDITYNQWSHVALVCGTTDTKIYINGNLKGSSGAISPLSILTLGSPEGQNTGNNLFDELRIDNIARTEDEILAWYMCNTPFTPKGDERLVY